MTLTLLLLSAAAYGQASPIFIAPGVHRDSLNPDVDSATVPEDIWCLGGLYPWPSAAAVTNLISTSPNDDVGNTGCETVTVEGLDANYLTVTQTANMDGVAQVNLPTPLLRINNLYCTTAGSTESNVGTISARHGVTVLSQILPTLGETRCGVYTVPADYSIAMMRAASLGAFRGATAGGVIEAVLYYRPMGSSWRAIDTLLAASGASTYIQYTVNFYLEPRSDIRWTVTAASANDMTVSAEYDIVLVP